MTTFSVNFGLELPKKQYNPQTQAEEPASETLAENFLDARRTIWRFTDLQKQLSLLEKARTGGMQELEKEEFDLLYEHLKCLPVEQKEVLLESFEETGIDIIEYEK